MKCPLDKKSIIEMSVDEVLVDEMSVYKMSVDEASANRNKGRLHTLLDPWANTKIAIVLILLR